MQHTDKALIQANMGASFNKTTINLIWQDINQATLKNKLP